MFYSLRRNSIEKAVRKGKKVKKGALVYLLDKNWTNQSLLELGLGTVDDQAELLAIDDAMSFKTTDYQLAFAKRAVELANADSPYSSKLYERAVIAINEQRHSSRPPAE